jgi:hypothetical protein
MQWTTLLITYPDGWQRPVSVGARGLRIGNAPDNDLVIRAPGVAPYHAIIRCGVHGRTRASGEAHGAPLLIDMPAASDSGAAVRVGGYTIRLAGAAHAPADDERALLRDLLARSVGAGPGPSSHDFETIEIRA